MLFPPLLRARSSGRLRGTCRAPVRQDRCEGVRLLLLATLVVTFVFTFMNGEWIGLAVAMAVVVAVLVLAWVLSRRIALVVSGPPLLTGLGFSAWPSGGWIDVAGIVVLAVVAVLVFAWARSRSKPPPGRTVRSARRDRLRVLHRQAHLDGLRELPSLAP